MILEQFSNKRKAILIEDDDLISALGQAHEHGPKKRLRHYKDSSKGSKESCLPKNCEELSDDIELMDIENDDSSSQDPRPESSQEDSISIRKDLDDIKGKPTNVDETVDLVETDTVDKDDLDDEPSELVISIEDNEDGEDGEASKDEISSAQNQRLQLEDFLNTLSEKVEALEEVDVQSKAERCSWEGKSGNIIKHLK